MTVQTLREDLQFLERFQGNVAQYIQVVRDWERLDAAAVEEAHGDGNEAHYTEEDSQRVKAYARMHRELLTSINQEIIRLRALVTRYQLAFDELWLFHSPTEGQTTPGIYSHYFTPGRENTIRREIELIRGALTLDLKLEQAREARSWGATLYEERILPTAGWFIKPEHSKFTLIAGLAILLALVLRLLGFDGKTIVDIIKAIRGKD
jgi:hypothetical protein